jgi:hypothetical protein
MLIEFERISLHIRMLLDAVDGYLTGAVRLGSQCDRAALRSIQVQVTLRPNAAI